MMLEVIPRPRGEGGGRPHKGGKESRKEGGSTQTQTHMEKKPEISHHIKGEIYIQEPRRGEVGKFEKGEDRGGFSRRLGDPIFARVRRTGKRGGKNSRWGV